MSVCKFLPNSHVRCPQITLFLALAMLCLVSSRSQAQGAPTMQWFDNPVGSVLQVAYSPDGTLLAIGGSGGWGVIELRRATTGQLVRSLKTAASGDFAGVNSVAFSPDGRTLADGGWYIDHVGISHGIVELWDVATGKLLRSVNTTINRIYTVTYARDGKTLAVGGTLIDSVGTTYGDIELWNVASGKLLRSHKTAPTGNYFGVCAVVFSPDGQMIADGGGRDIVEVWSVSTGRTIHTFHTGANNNISSVAFSPDGKLLADGGAINNSSSSYQGVLEVWNLSTGKRIYSLGTIASYNVYSVAFSPDGKTLANAGTQLTTGASSNRGIVELWNMTTGKLIQSLPSKTYGNYSVAFSPDGKTLVDGGTYVDSTFWNHGTLEFWNVSTGTLIQSIHANDYNILSLAFSPDAKTLVIGRYNADPINRSTGFLELRNTLTGALRQLLNTSADHGVYSVAFSPDGDTVAVGGATVNYDSVLELWNVSKGKLLWSLPTVIYQRVNSVAFSPDGNTLADAGSILDSTGRTQGMVELWNVSTGKLLRSLQTNVSSELYAVAFSPDGKTLVDGGYSDKTNELYGIVDLWDVPMEKFLRSLPTTASKEVFAVAISPDGKTLVDGGLGTPGKGILEFWNGSTGELIRSLNLGFSMGSCVAFSPDGKAVANGQPDVTTHGVLETWNVSTGKPLFTFDHFVGDLRSLAFSPNGEYIAYGGDYGLIVMALNPLYVPPTLQSLSVASTNLTGGESTTGNVVLSGPAPTLNDTVTLTSSNTAVVTVPASVTLSSVTTGISFPITTKKVTAKTTVTIKATLGSVSKSVTLTVAP